MANDSKLSEKIMRHSMDEIMAACQIRYNIGRLSDDEERMFFEKYIGNYLRLIELLYSGEEDLEILALYYIELYYVDKDYAAKGVVKFVKAVEERESRQACSISLRQKNSTSNVMQTALCCLGLMSSEIAEKFLTDLCLKGSSGMKKFDIRCREVAFSSLVCLLLIKFEKHEDLSAHDTFKEMLRMMAAFPPSIQGGRIRDDEDPESLLRRGLMHALYDVPGRKITEALIHAAKNDPQEILRVLACEALGGREEDIATRALVEICAIEELYSVQYRAMEALFSRRDKFALEYFRKEVFENEEYHYPLQVILKGLDDFFSPEFVGFLLREVMRSDDVYICGNERIAICAKLPGHYRALCESEGVGNVLEVFGVCPQACGVSSACRNLREDLVKTLCLIWQNDPEECVRSSAFVALMEIFGVDNLKKVLLAPEK